MPAGFKPESALRPAVSAKLVIVMGKGGVGKTTLAAALALRHARAGRKVGLASLTSRTELAHDLGVGWGALPPTLELLEMEPRRLVDEGMARLLPLPALATLVSSHPAYDALYHIAPGVKELAVLHRLVELSEQAYDLLVVDGMATGHGTHFLEAPRKTGHLLVGRLAERARAIDAALREPARTSVLLATTLEEMPVRETLDLAAGLRAAGLPFDGVLANRVVPRLFPRPGDVPLLQALARRPRAAAVASELGASWGAVQRMVNGALHVEAQAREQEAHLAALAGAAAPLVRVPFLPVEEGRLRVVAGLLEEAGL